MNANRVPTAFLNVLNDPEGRPYMVILFKKTPDMLRMVHFVKPMPDIVFHAADNNMTIDYSASGMEYVVPTDDSDLSGEASWLADHHNSINQDPGKTQVKLMIGRMIANGFVNGPLPLLFADWIDAIGMGGARFTYPEPLMMSSALLNVLDSLRAQSNLPKHHLARLALALEPRGETRARRSRLGNTWFLTVDKEMEEEEKAECEHEELKETAFFDETQGVPRRPRTSRSPKKGIESRKSRKPRVLIKNLSIIYFYFVKI